MPVYGGILQYPHMIRLRTLGVLDLRDEQGLELRSILQQPKRLALLALLTIAAPHRYHRRDSLVAMFWPELDDSHARAALRRSLHFLRAGLGAATLASRGEEEICVTGELLWCDAVAFDEAIRSGDMARAMELYGGNLLEGFHIADAPAFEVWLDRERGRLRDAAKTAAWALSEAAERTHSADHAATLGRRAYELSGNDEEDLRRLLSLLNRVGERSAALAAYDRFSRSLALQEDVEPEPETRALFDSIRAQPRSLNGGSAGVAAARTQLVDQASRPAPQEVGTEPVPSQDFTSVHSATPRWRRRALSLMVPALALGGLFFLRHRTTALDPRRVVVAPFENRTGTVALDPLGLIAADWIARGLSETRLVTVVDASPGSIMRAEPVAPSGIPYFGRLGVKTKAGTIVGGSYYRQGDSLYFEAKVFDGSKGGVLTPLAPAGAIESEPLVAIEAVRQRTMVTLASQLDMKLRDFPPLSQPPTYQAYRDFAEGIGLHIKRDYRQASRAFLNAAASDSQFAAPLVFAAVDHFSLALDNSPSLDDFATSDSLLRLAAKHRGRLTTVEAATIDWLKAKLSGDNIAALDVSRRFSDLAPGSWWEFQRGLDAYLVNRHTEAIEVLTQMDPDGSLLRGWVYYWMVLAAAYHVTGDHNQELRISQQARERYGNTLDVLAIEMGALAALGRLEELQTRVAEAEAARPAPWASPGFVLMLVAEELRTHGYADASQALSQRALRWYRDQPARQRATQSNRAEYAEVLYSAEQWQASRRIFEELTTQDRGMVPYKFFLGLLAARLGDSVKAERISQELSNVELPYVFGHVTYARACIASLLGQRERAVELLRRAFSQGLMYGMLGLHHDRDLEPLRGYPAFEDLRRPK